jgi:peptide/nickel transport system substrate-binding protein
MIRRWGLLLAVVVAAAVMFVLVAACGSSGSSGSTSPAPKAQLLSVAANYEPTTWDPCVSYSAEGAWMTNMYEGLIKANPIGSAQQFAPCLATSWDVSSDGLTWTFHLRKGVKFHDGTDFNADAVKYSIDREKRINQGAAYEWGTVKSVDVVDPYTVNFVLSQPTKLDAIAASQYGAWMISPASASKGDKWFDEGPHEAGTGPYTLASFSPKDKVVFKKFDSYWGGWKQGQYTSIVVLFVPDITTERQMLESGQVAIAQSIDMKTALELQSNSAIKVLIEPSFFSYIVQLNTQKPPLDNLKVRQALSYATPYQDIIAACAQGNAVQGRGIIANNLWPNDPSVHQYTYDPEKAKQLLAEAGYPNGGFKLVATFNSNRQEEAQAYEVMKVAYAKLGINLVIKPLALAQQYALAKGPAAKRQDMTQILWYPDYSNGYNVLVTAEVIEKTPSWNFSYWYNPAYDKLIAEGALISGTDVAKAKPVFIKAENMLVDQAVGLWLYDSKATAACRTTVQGVALNANYPLSIDFYAVTAGQ